MKNWIIGLLGFVCLGLGVYAFSLNGQLREARRLAVADRIDEVEEKLASKVADIAEVPEDGMQTQGVVQAVVPDVVREVPAENQVSSREESRRERMAEFAARFDDPETRMDMVDDRMNRLDGRYSDFFRKSGLSLDQIEVVKSMLAEKDVLRFEGRMKTRAAATDEERQAAMDSIEQMDGIANGVIEETIGAELAASLQAYTENTPHRETVKSLSESLSYTSTPINDSQSDALVEAIANAANAFEYTENLSNVRRGGNMSEESVETYWQERESYEQLVISNASTVLNSEQLAVFAEQQISKMENERRRMEFSSGRGPGRGGR